MLRNLGVTGLVASLMGGFVLAMQGLNPAAQQPPEMPAAVTEGQPQNPNGVSASPQSMIAQGPATGQGQPQAATGSAPMTAQPAMPTQQKPMMGMCGGMMKMMMGGQMNQSGGTM